jgi:hypothetical protein
MYRVRRSLSPKDRLRGFTGGAILPNSLPSGEYTTTPRAAEPVAAGFAGGEGPVWSRLGFLIFARRPCGRAMWVARTHSR